MAPTWQEKQEEYAQKKARAKALKLRLTCTICGEKAKLNCPCGTTQCAPGADTRTGRRDARTGRRDARERVAATCANGSPRRANGSGAARRVPSQVLLDGLSTHRLARPGPPEGVQEDPRRAGGGGGARGGADAPAVAPARRRLRPRAAVGRRRGPRAHRRRTRGGPRAARGGAGAGEGLARFGAIGTRVPDLLRALGPEHVHDTSALLLPTYMRLVREKVDG